MLSRSAAVSARCVDLHEAAATFLLLSCVNDKSAFLSVVVETHYIYSIHDNCRVIDDRLSFRQEARNEYARLGAARIARRRVHAPRLALSHHVACARSAVSTTAATECQAITEASEVVDHIHWTG